MDLRMTFGSLGALLLALLLLIGLEAGHASGAREVLEEVSSFEYGAIEHCRDLAWDGGYLWATDPNAFKVWKLDTSGNIISSFTLSFGPHGLTWDGEHLWIGRSEGLIYEFDTDGNIISSFRTTTYPRGYPMGLAWDGEHLWVGDSEKIFKYDRSGNASLLYDLGQEVRGLAWDGEHLWAVVAAEGIYKFYKFDISGNLVSSFDPFSSSPKGLTWDGEHLWVADSVEKRIYQVRVTSYPELLVSSVPSGGGTISLSPLGGAYSLGTQVTLTADPGEGYQFDHWSGDASGTSPSITVSMDSDKNVTAHFLKIETPGTSLVWICVGVAVVSVIIGVLVVRRLR